MAFVYAFAYLSSGENLAQARSTNILFITLFGVLVLWNMHGIRVLQPRTFLEHPRIFGLGLALGAFTLIGPYVASGWLEFTPPSTEQWIFVIATFVDLNLMFGYLATSKNSADLMCSSRLETKCLG